MHDTVRQRSTRALRSACLGLALAALPAAADQGAADYRHHVMEAIGGHMQSMADILRRKVPHQQHMRLHANALADMAEITDTLFPEGSAGGHALPAIWDNPEDFAERIASFREAALSLRQAVDDDDNVGRAVQQLGQSCKDCHDSYREE